MRVEPVGVDQLDADGLDLYKTITGPRSGRLDGPFQVWLKANPALASRMNDVGALLRGAGNLDKRLLETAVLCVARFWDTRYQWTAHAPLALELGISQESIDDIGRGLRPRSAPADEQAVYDLSMSLLERHRIPEHLYEPVLTQIGFGDMVELITVIGQYSLAAIVSNGFEIDPPPGGPPLPERGQEPNRRHRLQQNKLR